jgi:hypothetical protein
VHSDKCLGDELMTAQLPSRGSVSPLSSVSVGALKDLGYTVSERSADSLPASNIKCPCNRRVRLRELGDSHRYLSDDEHNAATEAGLSLFAGNEMIYPNVSLAVLYQGRAGTETVMVQRR